MAVLDRNIWHDACHGIGKRTAHYYLELPRALLLPQWVLGGRGQGTGAVGSWTPQQTPGAKIIQHPKRILIAEQSQSSFISMLNNIGHFSQPVEKGAFYEYAVPWQRPGHSGSLQRCIECPGVFSVLAVWSYSVICVMTGGCWRLKARYPYTETEAMRSR